MDALAAYHRVNEETTESVIRSHAVMVKRMAYHLIGRLPRSVQLDDLIQAGMLGLLDALKHYDATKGASFETYASIRVRGHMLDEVRRNDWVPRSVYRNSRMIAEGIRNLENQLGRDAKDSEIAEFLNITLDDYYSMIQDSAGSQLYGFDDVGVDDDILCGDKDSVLSEPHREVIHENLMNYLSAVIKGLSKKEQMVLSLYYEQELNLKEIGEVLGVSESRISQILTQATLRIRARISEH